MYVTHHFDNTAAQIKSSVSDSYLNYTSIFRISAMRSTHVFLLLLVRNKCEAVTAQINFEIRIFFFKTIKLTYYVLKLCVCNIQGASKKYQQ